MTNREAILRAIRQDPESDHLRLALADACDDEGLSLYAEFVRKQVEFSRMSPDRRSPVQRLILRGIRKWYNLRNRIDNYFPKWVQIDTRVGPGATMLSELSDEALERCLGLTEVSSLTWDWSYIYTVEARRRAKRNESKKS